MHQVAKYLPYGAGLITGATALAFLWRPTTGKRGLLVLGTLGGIVIGFAGTSYIVSKTVKHPEVGMQNG